MNSSAFSPMVEPRGAFRRRQKFQFGGTPATTSASSTSSTTSDVGQGTPYPALRSGIMQKAMDMINQQYQPYDPSQRFAPFNQDQLNAFQGVRNAQGMWAPYSNSAFGSLNQAQAGAAGVGSVGSGAFNRAGTGPTGTGAAMPWMQQASQSWTDPGVANSWMNPFTSNVMQNTANTAMRSFMGPGGAWQGITDAFTGGGAAQFGRQRMGDVTNLALSGFGQGLGNSLGQLANTGYGQGMQGFQNQQQLYGNLGANMGNLANQQMSAFTNLGTAQTGAAAQGVNANIAAGQAQSQLGQNVQAQNYRDLTALQGAGQTQQQQAQRLADFNYQQNREAIQFPIQWLQGLQGLGQGWQLPSQTTGQSSTFSSQTPAGGSTAGNVLGAGLSIAGLFQPNAQGQSAGGNILSGIGNLFGNSGSGTQYATGGGVRPRSAFSAGGYAPIVQSLRRSAQTRQPAMMKRLQALQGQGAPGGGMPGGGGPPMPGPPGGAPPAAFARGGAVSDEAQDKALVRKGVHQHERKMHGAKRLTKLQLRRGGRAAFAGGGDTYNFLKYRRLARPKDWWDADTWAPTIPAEQPMPVEMPSNVIPLPVPRGRPFADGGEAKSHWWPRDERVGGPELNPVRLAWGMLPAEFHRRAQAAGEGIKDFAGQSFHDMLPQNIYSRLVDKSDRLVHSRNIPEGLINLADVGYDAATSMPGIGAFATRPLKQAAGNFGIEFLRGAFGGE